MNDWDQRFEKEGKVWGWNPCRATEPALEVFQRHQVRNLLVPGCAYGRNALFFADQGLTVTGLDASKVALSWAAAKNGNVRWLAGSVLDADVIQEEFDGIFCQALLHLFPEPDRRRLAENCRSWLRRGGVAFVSVFSEQDMSYGRGARVEENTFESRPQRPAHYSTEADLRGCFERWNILDSGLIEEPEDHLPDGPHVHTMRYLAVEKPLQ